MHCMAKLLANSAGHASAMISKPAGPPATQMLDRAFDLFHRGVILPDVLDDEDIGRRLVAVRERLACRISAFLAVMHPSRRSVMHPPRLQQWAKPQPKGSVAVFVVHNGQMESKAPHANQTAKIKFADVPWLDCSKTYAVRDLYAKQAAVPAQASGGSYEEAEALAPVSSRMFLFTPV